MSLGEQTRTARIGGPPESNEMHVRRPDPHRAGGLPNTQSSYDLSSVAGETEYLPLTHCPLASSADWLTQDWSRSTACSFGKRWTHT